MPGEQQGIDGNKWNKEINKLLNELGWVQLGDSNIDLIGADKKEHHLDSVFYYEDPLSNNLNKIGVIVEAKHYAWANAGPSVMQEWLDKQLSRLSGVPRAQEFIEKFTPPENCHFKTGIIFLWHHDRFEHDTFQGRLKKLTVPKRNLVKQNFIISNKKILQICAVLNMVKGLEGQDNLREIRYFFPYRDTEQPINASTLPIEYFFSQYIFIKATRMIEKSNGGTDPVSENYVFYFGDITKRGLEFVDLTCNEIQLSGKIILYASQNIHENRSHVENFKRNSPRYEVRQLELPLSIPEWITRDS